MKHAHFSIKSGTRLNISFICCCLRRELVKAWSRRVTIVAAFHVSLPYSTTVIPLTANNLNLMLRLALNSCISRFWTNQWIVNTSSKVSIGATFTDSALHLLQVQIHMVMVYESVRRQAGATSIVEVFQQRWHTPFNSSTTYGQNIAKDVTDNEKKSIGNRVPPCRISLRTLYWF